MPKFKTVETEFEGRAALVPVIPNLSQLILEQIQKTPERFEMGSWHCNLKGDDDGFDGPSPKDYKKCGTAHCVAGWAITLAGAAGIELERKFHAEAAAQMLFQHSALGEDFPSFYASAGEALEDLQYFARREADVIASMELDGSPSKVKG